MKSCITLLFLAKMSSLVLKMFGQTFYNILNCFVCFSALELSKLVLPPSFKLPTNIHIRKPEQLPVASGVRGDTSSQDMVLLKPVPA